MKKILIYSSIVAIILGGCTENSSSCNINNSQEQDLTIDQSMIGEKIVIDKGEEVFIGDKANIQRLTANIKDINSLSNINEVKIKVSFTHLNQEKFYKSFSNKNGNIEIDIDLNLLEYDSIVIISAYKDNFIPISKTFRVDELNNFLLELEMQRITENVVIIEIEKNLHHLGDTSYSTDNFNSKFQSSLEGISFSKSFDIPKVESTYHNANLIFYAKGLELNNTITFNNQSWNIIPSKGDGSYTLYTIPLLKGDFVEKNNIITIVSDTSDYNSSDYDNFEFSNLEIEFYNLEGL